MLRQLALSLTLAGSLAAQTTETIDVRVMEIDAVVVDRKGNLVNGLTRDDFEVYVGGKRRQPSNFYAVRESLVVTEQDGSGVEQPATASAQTAPDATSRVRRRFMGRSLL